jgi:hypothetical protein
MITRRSKLADRELKVDLVHAGIVIAIEIGARRGVALVGRDEIPLVLEVPWLGHVEIELGPAGRLPFALGRARGLATVRTRGEHRHLTAADRELRVLDVVRPDQLHHLVDGEHTLAVLALAHVRGEQRDRDGGEDSEDRDNNHELDQREPFGRT